MSALAMYFLHQLVVKKVRFLVRSQGKPFEGGVREVSMEVAGLLG